MPVWTSAEKAEQQKEHAEAYSRQLETAMTKYHKSLIESALVHAVLGGIEKVDVAIGAAHDPSFPEDWRLTLKGVANLHRGNNKKAIEQLESAVRRIQ